MSSATRLDARRRERATTVAEAVHSAELEGQQVPAETLADMQDYIDGAFDADELVRRTRARHGLA